MLGFSQVGHSGLWVSLKFFTPGHPLFLREVNMKVWILVFVVAVWTQLPAEGSAKNLGPALRSVTTNKLSEIAKVAKRENYIDSSSEEDIPSLSSEEDPDQRSVPTNKLSEIAKVAKRDDSSSEEDFVSLSSSEEVEDKDSELMEFLNDSDQRDDFLRKNFLLVDLIKESVDEDEDIPEKDKMLATVRRILIIAGIDVDELDFLQMDEE